MYKNVAGQIFRIFAWDGANQRPKINDADNITAQIVIDGGSSNATDDTHPTEMDEINHPGVYYFNATQAETNGNQITVTPVSTTDDIEFRPLFIDTVEPMRGTDNAALASVCTETRLAELDAENLPTDIATIPTNPILDSEDGSSFDNIPDMATATNQATIAGYIDTEVGAIKVVTDNLPDSGALTTLISAVGAIPTNPMLDTEDGSNLSSIMSILSLLEKYIENKKILNKTGDTWQLIIYDDDNTTPILTKNLKDKDGDDITDLTTGTLAQEIKSSV